MRIKDKYVKTKELLNKIPMKTKSFLQEIPSTNLKNTLACIAAIFSVIAYWLLTYLEKDINPITLGTVLGFIFSWLFDGRKQFLQKRQTQWVPEGLVLPKENDNDTKSA